MTSAVQMRKPRDAGGGRIGRPKSWTEFNTRFQAFSAPINIDLSPVPKMKEDAVKKREPNNYRKVRPLSASILDSSLDVPDHGSARPPSPKYTSFMAPNPWRNVDTRSKNVKNPGGRNKTQSKNSNPRRQLQSNYDETADNYDEIKKPIDRGITGNNSPEGRKLEGNDNKNDNFPPKKRHSESFSDSDSVDSAVVVSGGSTPYGTSSEKSPKWRHTSVETEGKSSQRIRNLDKSASESVNIEKTAQEIPKSLDLKPNNGEAEPGRSRRSGNAEKSEEHKSTASLTLSPPRILVSKASDRVKMEFFPDDDVIRFAESSNLDLEDGNYERRTVPSPLKSCYAPVATYDDFVEYSDSENSSGEENSVSDFSRSNTNSHQGYDADKSAEEYQSKTTPTARPRQSSMRGIKSDKKAKGDDVIDDTKTHYDVKSGTWPRRRGKKKEDSVNHEELMKMFRKTREDHLAKFQTIYEESRKRIMQVMESLKNTMTENGYREWYPKVR